MFTADWSVYTVLIALTMLVTAIHTIKIDHQDAIYTIWYTYFLSFSLLFLITVALGENLSGFKYDQFKTAEPYFRTITNYVIDFKGEVTFVCVIIWLGLVPQTLAYLISGLSGSAIAPRFVATITKTAIWSIIKFIAIYAGLILARGVWLFVFIDKLHAYISLAFFYEFVWGLAVSFSLVAIYFKGSAALAHNNWTKNRRILGSIGEFMTRYRVKTIQTEPIISSLQEKIVVKARELAKLAAAKVLEELGDVLVKHVSDIVNADITSLQTAASERSEGKSK